MYANTLHKIVTIKKNVIYYFQFNKYFWLGIYKFQSWTTVVLQWTWYWSSIIKWKKVVQDLTESDTWFCGRWHRILLKVPQDSTEIDTWFYWKWHRILLIKAQDSTEGGIGFYWKWDMILLKVGQDSTQCFIEIIHLDNSQYKCK